MKFAHAMPFGAMPGEVGTRFRLWAPEATQVMLELSGGGRDGADRRPLEAVGEGWFESLESDAPPGTRYAFRIDGGPAVPDPASRANPDGVHAASIVVDPLAYDWRHEPWLGRCWDEAVLYELHVGTFTREGTFAAAIERLDYLADLGITALELMPVAAFPGSRNWGYDGVLQFAPAACYGTPEDLKRLIDAAHGRGLMVLLDVVYNHFGPEGNYLHAYAKRFFDPVRQTPWGAAINFDGEDSRTVRDFYIHNARFWIDEYRFDGLRLDAVHAIADASRPDIVAELADTVRQYVDPGRHVHLILENDRNESSRLIRAEDGHAIQATAQWNDDIHHALHVLVTGEVDGYYADYALHPLRQFGRCLTEGFAYQGEHSPFRGGEARGEASAALPAGAFVNFTQTHDQVGNRAFGERLVALATPDALREVTACVLLSPSPPMLFMGEEFGARTPFQFFCDFGPELADAVVRGRRAEFGRFVRFRDPAMQALIPDPNAAGTFEASKLDWSEIAGPPGSDWLAFYRRCLRLRHQHIVPRLRGAEPGGRFVVIDDALLRATWTLGGGARLHLVACFAAGSPRVVDALPGFPIYESQSGIAAGGDWPGTAVAVSLEDQQ
ncbi:MAG: malto-oligosyltrehalose trehalohydrolase [Betaproteobacteria bacterium]